MQKIEHSNKSSILYSKKNLLQQPELLQVLLHSVANIQLVF